MKPQNMLKKTFTLFLVCLICFSTLSVFVTVPNVNATVLFTSGWEDSGGSDVTDGGLWNGTNGSPEVSSTWSYQGTYSLKINADNEAINITTPSSYPTAFWQSALNFSAIPTGSGEYMVLMRCGQNGTNWAAALLVGIKHNGTDAYWWMYNQDYGQQYYNGTMVANMTYTLTVEFNEYGSGSDECRLYVADQNGENEELVIRGQFYGNGHNAQKFALGGDWNGVTPTVYYDTAVLSDTKPDPQAPDSGEPSTISGSLTDLTFPYNATQAGTGASIKANWTTTGTLDSFWWEHNSTGTTANQTAQAFSGTWANSTLTLNSTATNIVALRCFANTTLGTENVTSTVYLTTTANWTIYLETVTPSLLQTAFDDGDTENYGTIYLPNGIFSADRWQINATGGVNLIGNGVVNTTLYQTGNYSSAEGGNSKIVGYDGSNGRPIEVSGINFNGTVDEDDEFGTGLSIHKNPHLMIHDCNFTNHGNSGIGLYDTVGTYEVKGLIYNCNFDQPYKDVAVGYVEWGYGILALVSNNEVTQLNVTNYLGNWTDGCIYVEDCTFSRCRHQVASQGGRTWMVVRYCNFSNPDPVTYGMIDVHGSQPSPANSGRGGEFYNNTITGTAGSSMSFALRAGSGVVYNNTMINCLYGVTLAHDSQDVEFRVREMFIWDNTFTNVGTEIYDQYGVYTEEVEYFLHAPNATGAGFTYTALSYPHFWRESEGATYYYLNITTPSGGTTDPAAGVYAYVDGNNATVTASASDGYYFGNWTDNGGDGGSTNPITITMSANHTLTANFYEIPNYYLNVTYTTGGTTNVTGVNEYENGTTVYVQATASTGFSFSYWLLDDVNNGSTNPNSVLMTANHSLRAVFIDSASPTYSGASHNTSYIGYVCGFTLTVNDNVALEANGQWQFGSNNTGAWVWTSAANFTSTPESLSATLTLNSTRDTVVYYMWNFTDNLGNSNTTGALSLTTAYVPAGASSTGFTNPLFQYVLEGDYLYFVVACYTTVLGQAFFGIIAFFLSAVIYIKTKSLYLVGVIYLMLGPTYIALLWQFSWLAVVFTIIGIASVFAAFIEAWRNR